MRSERTARLGFVVALLAASPATAFVDPASFFDDAAFPHAATVGAATEGIYFTGAPRFSSLTCRACHVEAPGTVRLRIGASDPTIFDTGYVPGQTYTLQVELLDEGAGLDFTGPTCTEPGGPSATGTYRQCNNNAFALEIDHGQKPLTTGFCQVPPVAGKCPAPDPSHDETLIAPGGDAVFANRPHDATTPRVVTRNGARQWSFSWTAPTAGTGSLTLYVAAVDGNGGEGTVAVDQDPIGDDVVEAAVPIAEAGGDALPAVSSGCGFGNGRTPSLTGLVLLVLVALLISGSRARTRRRRG